MNDETYKWGCRWVLTARFDEVCVDYGVEEVIVYGVVNVGVLVIVTPACPRSVRVSCQRTQEMKLPSCAVVEEVGV